MVSLSRFGKRVRKKFEVLYTTQSYAFNVFSYEKCKNSVLLQNFSQRENMIDKHSLIQKNLVKLQPSRVCYLEYKTSGLEIKTYPPCKITLPPKQWYVVYHSISYRIEDIYENFTIPEFRWSISFWNYLRFMKNVCKERKNY